MITERGTGTVVRVLIVDDVQASRETLRRAFAFDDSIEVVGEAGSGREAIARAEELQPDLVLMDVRMPDGDGVDATRHIVERLPHTRVVALTAHDDVYTVRDMLTAGATGYFLKGAPVDDLLEAVHRANRGEGQMDERVLPNAIDELRRLLQGERERRAEVERVAQMRQEFTQVLSHELRTPLTVMSGALRFMERRGLSAQESALVASAIQRAGEVERMIEGLELIADTRGEEGGTADPARAVRSALTRLEQIADLTDVREGRWGGVRDRHLERIALELIDNALRHGRRPLEIRAGTDEGWARLQVSDAGDADLAPDLFEAFAQGDMSATRERGGLGLGLFIAYRLAEADGGRLTLRREDGRTVAEVVYDIA